MVNPSVLTLYSLSCGGTLAKAKARNTNAKTTSMSMYWEKRKRMISIRSASSIAVRKYPEERFLKGRCIAFQVKMVCTVYGEPVALSEPFFVSAILLL